MNDPTQLSTDVDFGEFQPLQVGPLWRQPQQRPGWVPPPIHPLCPLLLKSGKGGVPSEESSCLLLLPLPMSIWSKSFIILAQLPLPYMELKGV